MRQWIGSASVHIMVCRLFGAMPYPNRGWVNVNRTLRGDELIWSNSNLMLIYRCWRHVGVYIYRFISSKTTILVVTLSMWFGVHWSVRNKLHIEPCRGDIQKSVAEKVEKLQTICFNFHISIYQYTTNESNNVFHNLIDDYLKNS